MQRKQEHFLSVKSTSRHNKTTVKHEKIASLETHLKVANEVDWTQIEQDDGSRLEFFHLLTPTRRLANLQLLSYSPLTLKTTKLLFVMFKVTINESSTREK